MIWLWVKPLPIGVRILLVNNDRIYLVKHIYEDYWYIPGGTVERGETLEQSVRREAWEEAGATLNDLQFFGAYSYVEIKKSSHIAVFISQNFILNGESDHEIESSGYFPLDNLPENMSPGSFHRIEEFKAGKRPGFGIW
jgi:8-oxo-dGTP pyrophosphatase MutT (NUDIX family)